jgi:arginase
MDSHTWETSPTKNIHGMPVAHLLGHGIQDFLNVLNTFPKLNPKHLVLIGIRSFETDEVELLRNLGVAIYYNHEVNVRGADKVLLEAWNYLDARVDKIGFSIDMDGFDPKYAPGVGTKEPNGVDLAQFLSALDMLHWDKVTAVEITEGNLHLDPGETTMNSMLKLIQHINQIGFKNS